MSSVRYSSTILQPAFEESAILINLLRFLTFSMVAVMPFATLLLAFLALLFSSSITSSLKWYCSLLGTYLNVGTLRLFELLCTSSFNSSSFANTSSSFTRFLFLSCNACLAFSTSSPVSFSSLVTHVLLSPLAHLGCPPLKMTYCRPMLCNLDPNLKLQLHYLPYL